MIQQEATSNSKNHAPTPVEMVIKPEQPQMAGEDDQDETGPKPG